MSQRKYPFNYQVFYFSTIKGFTRLGQRKVLNALFVGDITEKDCRSMNDAESTKILHGKSRINQDLVQNVLESDDVDILRRVCLLGVQKRSCLDKLKLFLKCNLLDIGSHERNVFLELTNADIPLEEILTKLFLFAIKNPDRITSDAIRELMDWDTESTRERDSYSETSKIDKDFFLSNYKKPLFWSSIDNISLEDLYVFNTYNISGAEKLQTDIEDLIKSFLSGDMRRFLALKNIKQYEIPNTMFITGYAGCGKTSLISKIADTYSKESFSTPMFFIRLSNWRDKSLSVDSIAYYLGISQETLRDSVIILDGLDEILKTVVYQHETMSALTEDLYSLNCKAIITCRKNLVDTKRLRYCVEICLHGFDVEQAKVWLEKYYTKKPDLDISLWKEDVDQIDRSGSELSRIVLSPLILYICVTREIRISHADSLGKLYDLLFNSSTGVAPATKYRERTNYRESEWQKLRDEVKRLSLIMYQCGSISKEKIRSSKDMAIKEKLALDFFVDISSDGLNFEHSSIWQYFVAESYYKALKVLEAKESIGDFLHNIIDITSPLSGCDDTMLSFISYFIERDKWKPCDPDVYQYALLHIADYPSRLQRDQLTLYGCSLRDLFSLSTLMYRLYYPDKLDTLFQDLSKQPYQSYLVRYSNIVEFSPFISLYKYQLNYVNLDKINFSNTDLSCCQLRYSHFQNANFHGATLPGVYANNTCFDGADFSHAILSNGDYTGSSFINCKFYKADLRGGNFSDTDLSYSDLRHALISKAKFSASLYKCKITIYQAEVFGLTRIFDNQMQVYDEHDVLIPRNNVEEKYKERYPVSYAFWKSKLRMSSE